MPSSDITSENNNGGGNKAVENLQYPRTGKRGVPQQFPRRLYEMLQSETKLIEASPAHPRIIFWSESGKAFRIADVAEFSASILPKYFRTKKFSSFQRNLNLYGFAKLRRGPETDMYSHPSFARDHAETLSELRKLTNTSSRRRCSRGSSTTANSSSAAAKMVKDHNKFGGASSSSSRGNTRSVSPSPTRMMLPSKFHAPLARKPQMAPPAGMAMRTIMPTYASPKQSSMWAPIHTVPLSPEMNVNAAPATTQQQQQQQRPQALAVPTTTAPAAPAPAQTTVKQTQEKSSPVGRGRLDLLALAMEQAAAMQ